MQLQHIDEFKELYQEFRDTFVNTPEGEQYIELYELNRQVGRDNFNGIKSKISELDINNPESLPEGLANKILGKLLPHSDTLRNRTRGFWVHHAPAIQDDIKKWYEADGSKWNWQAIAYSIFRFIESCLEYPDGKQLQHVCDGFNKSTYVKGFQSGMLSPILNSLKPNIFLLVNSKSQSTIAYLSGEKCSTKLTDYSATNAHGKRLIQKLSPLMRTIWDPIQSDADQFDMFCHWLVSIKKLGFETHSTRYWKIAPGANAWQWEECRDQGFIALEWKEFGDITGLNRSEFNQRVDEVLVSDDSTEWSKAGVQQLWHFSRIREGDRIVANNGTKEVLGIGTVTGPYYYDAAASRSCHRIPVEWNDLTLRFVDQPGWRRTLVKLDQKTFDDIINAKAWQVPNNQTEIPDHISIEVNPGCPFNLTTFDLLSKLHHTPKKSVYDDQKQDFKNHLEEPFQHLMQEVAAQLPTPMTELMETRSRIFARILKNDWGQGGAWDFYWGAFYPKGGKRTEDAQLFLWMSYERLECGFYIGQYGSEQRQRFLENCRIYQADLAERLQPTLDREGIVFGSRADTAFRADGVAINRKGIGFSEWIKAPNDSDIHVAAVLSKEEVLSKSKAELSVFIRETYEQVFPLVQLATFEEPMAQLQEYLEPAEDVIETHPVYPLAQCAADTSLDPALLQTWVDAIERKGQAILYGPPGTGKTFLAEHLSRHLLSDGDGFSALVQFHPAYTYEDFIQGIRPKPGKNGGLEYPVEPGRFLQFCERARIRKDTCILIIDEINRANLAQVFGELMYLLEYRDKAVELAGGTSFKIPNNVRIIGTMNTADRSIALVDHALRRRFAFLPLYPDMNILRKFHAGTGFAVDGLVQTLTEVNRAISDRQYELGTSFFLRKALSAELPAIWQMEIEPYLEEYFFDRPEQVDKFRWTTIQSQLQL